MAKAKEKNKPQEAGVNELIRRLRKKGVDEGKSQATEIISKAEAKAKAILAKAEKDAEKITSGAKKKADKLKTSANESIKIAFRDSILELKGTIQDSFIKELRAIVKDEVSDKKLVREMILKAVDSASAKTDMEILIADPVKDDEIVKASVYKITKAMLKGGIVLKTFATKDKRGIIIKETKKGIEVELTDKALSDLLLEHLLPTYRDLLQGEKK